MGWGFVQVRLVDDAAGNETRSLKKPEPLAVGEFANSNLTPQHGEFKAYCNAYNKLMAKSSAGFKAGNQYTMDGLKTVMTDAVRAVVLNATGSHFRTSNFGLQFLGCNFDVQISDFVGGCNCLGSSLLPHWGCMF